MKYLGIWDFFKGFVTQNFRGGAIGDWVACGIYVQPKIYNY